MKKLFPIVLVAAAFTLVGCTAEKPGSTMETTTGFSQPKEKCKGKKPYRGKFGVEKTTKDMIK